MPNLLYSLKFKLISTILVILGAMLLFQFFLLGPKVRSHEIEEFVDHQKTALNNINNIFEISFQKNITELRAVSELVEQVFPDREKLDSLLSNVNSVTQSFNYYFVLDSIGHWVSYPGNPSQVGKKIQDNGWVTRAFSQRGTEFVDVHYAKSINRLVAGFTLPFYDETGEPLGLVRGVILVSDENNLLQKIRAFTLGTEGYAYLVDSKGRLLAHPSLSTYPADLSRYDYSSYPPVQKAIKGENGVVEYEYDGRMWLASYQPVAETGWGLIVQQPFETIFGHIGKSINTVNRLVVLSFALVAVILTFLVQQTLRPLVKLADAVRTGDQHQPESTSRDEIGLISRQLINYRDNMEELVEKRTAEIEQINTALQNEISVRQQIADTMRDKEIQYRHFFSTVPNGWAYHKIIVDEDNVPVDHVFLEVNPAFEKITGLSHEKVVGKRVTEVMPGVANDPVDWIGTLGRVAQTGQSISMDTFSEQLQKWISMTVSSPKEGYFITVFSDISELMRTTEALRESEKRYRAVVEDQTDLICRFKPDGIITFVNEAYCRYFHKQADQLIGTTFFPNVPEEDQVKIRQCLDALTPGAPVGSVMHRVMVPFSRMYCWHNWSNRAIFGSDGQISEYQGTGSDITKRKTIETALRLSEQRFRGAFEYATHGIALVGLDGDWLRVNKALCQIVGYFEEELLQTNFQNITHPDDLEADLGFVKRLIDGEIPSYQMEKRYFHKQGHTVWVLLSVSLVRDENDNPHYFVSQIQDFSARKHAEEALVAAQAELENQVAKRTAELAEAYGKLREYVWHEQQIREQERQGVAREIHDELGQSLTALKFGLTWLRRKVDAAVSGKDAINKKIESLATLTDATIDTVHKISTDLRPGLLDELGLISALEWYINNFQINFDIPCAFTNNVKEYNPFSKDLSIALYRICQEALTNIARHAEATEVRVMLENRGNTLVLTVIDNGKGLLADQISDRKSYGLIGIKERLFPLGGTLEIGRENIEGTSIIVTIPMSTG